MRIVVKVIRLFTNPRGIILAILGAVFLWMLITPIYLFVLSLADFSVWIWMGIAVVGLLIIAKYHRVPL